MKKLYKSIRKTERTFIGISRACICFEGCKTVCGGTNMFNNGASLNSNVENQW